jgi:hypothetical protein
MRGVRQIGISVVVLTATLLLVAAAAPPDVETAPTPRLLAQPMVVMNPPLFEPWSSARLPESGLMILIGGALLGLGTVVRRATRT